MKESEQNNERYQEFLNFSDITKQNTSALNIVKREVPKESDVFFKKIHGIELTVSCLVNTKNTYENLSILFNKIIPNSIKEQSYYDVWLRDITKICDYFAEFIEKDNVILWLSTKRVCQNFHVDKTPWRILVTYYGERTEWTPKKITEISETKDLAIDKVGNWDICLMRGGSDGIVHKSPTNHKPWSVLLRLDDPEFKKIIV